MKKIILTMAVIIVVLVVIFVSKFLKGGSEDKWIKDSRGVWVKYGQPSITPDYVLTQQALIKKALDLYNTLKSEGIDFSNGPCLGRIDDDWVVDVAHQPRQAIDNLVENQCQAFRGGEVHHFIELTPEGEIIRIY